MFQQPSPEISPLSCRGTGHSTGTEQPAGGAWHRLAGRPETHPQTAAGDAGTDGQRLRADDYTASTGSWGFLTSQNTTCPKGQSPERPWGEACPPG